jgi:hypothetical protein
MTDCCSSDACTISHPNKRPCPVSRQACAEVTVKAISHHIRDAWAWRSMAERYFFCDDPACDVVYFGDDGTLIRKSQLRTRVGVKEAAEDALVCYCFGVTKADALRDSSIREYVLAQTRDGLCSCDSSNPSGRCCLKNFPQMSE